MVQFLRHHPVAMWILTVLRIYIGWQWILAAMDKFNPKFTSAGMIMGAFHQGQPGRPYPYPWFTEFLRVTTNSGHNPGIFNIIVPIGELLVGLGLIFGTFTLAAAFFGLIMNFTYVLCGVVSDSPTFILIEFLILMSGYNAAKIGLDYWVTPFLRKHLPFLNNDISLRKA